MNKELDELFEFKEEPDDLVENVIKDAKNRSATRIVSISLGVWAGAIALLAILMMQVSPLILDKHVIDGTIYHKLYGANTHIGNWREDYKIIGSTAEANQYKIIGGEVVPVGQIHEPMNNFITPRIIKVEGGSWYTDTGIRIMQFYHPEAQYTTYLNELDQIAGLEDDEVAEVALSFDKAYSIEEVERIIGTKATLNWGWIATGEGQDERIYSAYDVLGMHYVDYKGSEIEDPEEEFIKLIDIGAYNGRESKELIKSIELALQGEDGVLTPSDLKLIGCVVTGSKEELSELQELDMIKAVSIGIIK